MDEATISFLILGVVVVLFVSNRLPVEVVSIGAGLALFFTGVLDANQIVAGFGDPVVVLIAALFVVSEGLDATGVTTWAGQQLMARAGTSQRRLTILMMLLVALLTAVISINGAVAALIPMVVVMAVKLRDRPSRYLMPLAFAGSAGSLLALTGTPVNVIVSNQKDAAGEGPFGYFEFALVGVPLLAVTVLLVVLLGGRLLPRRTSRSTPEDLSGIATDLVAQYRLADDTFLLRVRSTSPLVGTPLGEAGLDATAGVVVLGVTRPDQGTDRSLRARLPIRREAGAGPVVPDGSLVLAVDDVLTLRGTAADVERLAVANALAVQPTDVDAGGVAAGLLGRELGVGEVVVTPRSPLQGTTIVPGRRRSDGLVVLAVARQGRDLGVREEELRIGDTLLVQGPWDDLIETFERGGSVVVDSPEVVRRQAVPMGPRAKRALAVTLVMVVLLATQVVPSVVAGLVAATLMIVFRVLSPNQAYRAISWTTIVLIGGMFPLSTALTETGAAASVADAMVSSLGSLGPYPLLAGVFVLTAVLSQLISNAATALIVAPIAVSAAQASDYSAAPFLMTVTVAAAAAFLTPVATPANMMVMGPAGYVFNDYWKLGAPIMVAFFAVDLALVPLFWPL